MTGAKSRWKDIVDIFGDDGLVELRIYEIRRSETGLIYSSRLVSGCADS